MRPLPRSANTVINSGVHFSHIRLQAHPGSTEISEQNPLKISGRGGATIAYKRSPDGKLFSYAFCICRLNENFFRALGRKIAENYLNHGSGYTIQANPEIQTEYYLDKVARPVAQGKLAKKNPGVELTYVGRRYKKNKVVC
jgi:hypothetical protein